MKGRVAALVLCGLLGALGVAQLLGNGGLVGWLLAGFLPLGADVYLRPRQRALARVGRYLGALAALIALVVVGLFVAWESAEVVVLRYTDERHESRETRLWVIELDGAPSVAMGSAKARVAAMLANPRVELRRPGDARGECRRARVIAESEATADAKREAERLYAEKYGWRLYATRILAFFAGAPPGEEPVLIRLEPCAE